MDKDLINQLRAQALLGDTGTEDADVLSVGGRQGGRAALVTPPESNVTPVGHIVVEPVGEDEHRPGPGPTVDPARRPYLLVATGPSVVGAAMKPSNDIVTCRSTVPSIDLDHSCPPGSCSCSCRGRRAVHQQTVAWLLRVAHGMSPATTSQVA